MPDTDAPIKRSRKTAQTGAVKFRADDEVVKDAGISGDTVPHYVRLTELQPKLQQMVDEKKIDITPVVEISYFKPEEQAMLLTAIDSEQAMPSRSLSGAAHEKDLTGWQAGR